jgi:hypothetical protein
MLFQAPECLTFRYHHIDNPDYPFVYMRQWGPHSLSAYFDRTP